MIPTLWVAAGSALGGVGRYGFGLLAARLWGESFPWGTIIINVVGSFVIGFFGALTVPDGAMPATPNLRLFVMVGLCGGFTTFSSFSLQTLGLARDGNWFGAMGNVVLSVVLCLLSVTIGHTAAERIGVMRTTAREMSRSIVVVLDQPQTARSVLTVAGLAAQQIGHGRIIALHLRHEALAGFMPTEEVLSRERQDEIEGVAARKSAEMRAAFDDWRSASRVGEWREVVGDAAQVVPAEAGNADLIVIGLDHGRGDAGPAIHAALFDARVATLLVPDAVPVSPGRCVAVAWKPSEAADRAITAALPLMAKAERVIVLIGMEDGSRGADDLPELERLRRSGIPATVHRFQVAGRGIGGALIQEAHAVQADLLVMGAYSHSRLAEAVLGGATQEVLAAADLPVLMRH